MRLSPRANVGCQLGQYQPTALQPNADKQVEQPAGLRIAGATQSCGSNLGVHVPPPFLRGFYAPAATQSSSGSLELPVAPTFLLGVPGNVELPAAQSFLRGGPGSLELPVAPPVLRGGPGRTSPQQSSPAVMPR